jgi:gliding motility-associated-like protein
MKIFLHRLKKRLPLFCVGCLFFLPFTGSGQVTIDSAKTTISTCPNNGSITVYARSTALPLVYSIVAGPVTPGAQTNNVFNSLPSGNYTVKVSDGAANNTSTSVTIGGSYTPLDFMPQTTSPYCTGYSNGQIVGNLTPGTGNAPFTWELINPSPITRAPQATDTFNNLISGNYTVRVTDACSSYRTIVASVSDPGIGSLGFAAPFRIEMINCHDAIVSIAMQASLFRFPLTYTFETTSGTFTTTSPTTIDTADMHWNGGYFNLQQLLPNFTYGNSVRLTVKNTCGYSVTSPIEYARNFTFCGTSNSQFKNCSYQTIVNFDINNPACVSGNQTYTAINAPVTYQFVNTATSLIVDSGTLAGDPAHGQYNGISGAIMKPVPNGNYIFTIKDACGNTYSVPYTVANAVSLPPKITSKSISKNACLDSAASAYIQTDHFKSEPLLILLSGPTDLGSTKPGYAYHATYTYPDTLNYTAWGGGVNDIYDFGFTNLGIGKYYFKIIDTCGSVIMDSITVNTSNVTNLGHKFWYDRGCLGKNVIHYTANTGSGYMSVSGPINRSNFYGTAGTINDSMLNVPSGNYQLSFVYQGPPGSIPVTGTSFGCQVINQNMTIDGYQTPTISTINYIICKGGTTIEVVPDSTKGVPPYQYEIVSGPQTFPVQNSNLFTVTQTGTYTARIYDGCGNASTAQITVDTITFPPVNRITPDCYSTTLFYGSSIYSTYKWTKPNGTIYTGDTLTINPITRFDTGFYSIQKIIHINGCTDTFNTTYHLLPTIMHSQTIPFCTGGSVRIGSHTYTSPGVYIDTLASSVTGCDSVVTSTLLSVQKKDTSNLTICKGSSITVGSNTYDSTGFYKDSVINAQGCYDLIFTNLTVKQLGNSIDTTICSTGKIVVGTHVYKTTGNYIDTLTSSVTGCDSIVVLNLTVIPATFIVLPTPINEFICEGDSLSEDGITYYHQTGIYKDTIITGSNCQELIITINLTVNPVIKDSLVKSICAGQSYTVGPHTYNTTGIYRDTLSAVTSCDSIVILNLTVNAVCAPTRLCSGATHVVWKDDFGSGTPIVGPASPAINPAYIKQNYGVVSGNYSLVNYFNYQTCCWHKVTEDHTPNDINGYFLVMDGGVPNFYSRQIDNLCPYTDYTFSTWTMNMDLISFPSLPTFIFNVTDVPGNLLGQITTPAIPVSAAPTWVQNGFTFNSGNNTSLKLNLILTSVGYNDFAFDDIEFSVCGPTLALTSTSSVCTNKVNVNAVLGSGYANPVYQWYKQDAGGVWNIITNANATTYTDNNPSTNNWYKLTVSDGASSCSFIEDSIQVTLSKPPLVPVIVDTSICIGQSVLGHTTPGQYIDTLAGASGCDSIQRTLNLIISPLKRDTINRTICQGSLYPFGSKTYGSSGVYRDTLSTLTCDSITVLNLTVTPALPIKIITNLTEVNKGDIVQLNTVSSAPYLWISTATISNKNIQDPTAVINDPSWIYLYATSNCPSVDSVFISVRGDSIIILPPPCNDSYIRMPNAFTPNHDGQNDVFKVIAKNIRLESFQIYDRWGQMVFQTSDMNAGWDGNFQGQPMSIGNYVYWLTYYDCNHVSTPEIIKGNIILIR